MRTSRDHGGRLRGGQSLWVPDAPLPTRAEHPGRGITFTSSTPTSVTPHRHLLGYTTASSTLDGGISRTPQPLVQAPQVSPYPDCCEAGGHVVELLP